VVFKSSSVLAAEFDEIAQAERAVGMADGLSSAERFIVGQIPAGAGSLVDVGCGSGRLTRAAVRRTRRALGVDLSFRMIASARSRTAPDATIDYRVSDVMTEELPEAPFDVVLTVNMVHHAPRADVVRRLVELTAPAGTVLIQDVVDRSGLRYALVNAAALARNVVAQPRAARSVRALYSSHGEGEKYLTPREVVGSYASLLPGAKIHHRLSWRYSIVWTRPLGS
jgi:2-polyprenyl-3-methyl-5-hydroxy-6-metoxy-1,4-benzoquinol methylase